MIIILNWGQPHKGLFRRFHGFATTACRLLSTGIRTRVRPDEHHPGGAHPRCSDARARPAATGPACYPWHSGKGKLIELAKSRTG